MSTDFSVISRQEIQVGQWVQFFMEEDLTAWFGLEDKIFYCTSVVPNHSSVFRNISGQILTWDIQQEALAREGSEKVFVGVQPKDPVRLTFRYGIEVLYGSEKVQAVYETAMVWGPLTPQERTTVVQSVDNHAQSLPTPRQIPTDILNLIAAYV